MARIRTIKPAMWASEKLGQMSVLARLTFVGLISQADDAGRGRGAPRFLAGTLHPYAKDVSEEDLAQATTALHDARLVQFYEVDGCRYYALPNWGEHQKIDRPQPSVVPPPPTNEPGLFDEHSTNGGRAFAAGMEGKGLERNGLEGKTELAPRPTVAAPALLTFECVGKGDKSWKLTQEHVDALRADYPNLDVMAEARKAHAWAAANPSRRKTPRGMAAFLANWMNRATDGAWRRSAPATAVKGGATPVAGKYVPH
jgi:hypothetical protein